MAPAALLLINPAHRQGLMTQRKIGIAGFDLHASPAKTRQLRVDIRFEFTHGFGWRKWILIGQRDTHLA
ncbi:hypothetical protein D3C87_1692760 [compost metagenome]